MNNRIDLMFARKRAENKKALITFVTAGDPDLAATRQLVLAMVAAGADLVELGVPYSDPLAEGPVIQAANLRALKNDVRLDTLFQLVAGIRKDCQAPIVFLLYLNCILQYGRERFFQQCQICGVDGVIVPDLPFEESEEIHTVSQPSGVRLIRMVAPTSQDRIARIAGRAEGFLYCVSSLGVTGVRSEFKTDFDSFFAQIDQFKQAPSAVGFGISTPEQVKKLRGYCDGIIVGSAIVKKVAAAATPAAAVEAVADFTGQLRAALDE